MAWYPIQGAPPPPVLCTVLLGIQVLLDWCFSTRSSGTPWHVFAPSILPARHCTFLLPPGTRNTCIRSSMFLSWERQKTWTVWRSPKTRLGNTELEYSLMYWAWQMDVCNIYISKFRQKDHFDTSICSVLALSLTKMWSYAWRLLFVDDTIHIWQRRQKHWLIPTRVYMRI